MHFSIAILAALPLSAFAHGGSVLRSKPEAPEWARQCNGKCTFTKTSTRTVWATKKITLQPKPATTTEVTIQTSTSTSTLAQDTSVFSTTSILYTTSTFTSTSTDTDTRTATATVTVAPGTSTIPAPAGFTPIKSVFPGANTPSKRSPEQRKQKQPAGPEVHVHDIKKCTSTKYNTVYSTKYRTSTSTAWRPRSTVTRKSTSTMTTVTSVLPTPASSTITVLSTSTISSTSIKGTVTTVTFTSTTTELTGPTPTFYAACADDNILTQVNGQYVSALYYAPPMGSENLGTFATAYECCVACAKKEGCMGAGWIASSICIGAKMEGTCDGSAIGGQFGAFAGTNPGWAVSNGACGQWGRRT